MLIDRRQKRWCFATIGCAFVASLIYGWFSFRSPRGLTGGSAVGLWYGILGSALMVYAGLLCLHRKLPSWWRIGRRATWLKGHIWLGSLSALLILFHSGFRWGGPVEFGLWIVLILILATGVLGLLLQNIVPRMLSRRIVMETPYEQIPHLCTLLRRKADALMDEVCGRYEAAAVSTEDGNTLGSVEDERRRVRAFYESGVRQFLGVDYRRTSGFADSLFAASKFADLRELAQVPKNRELLEVLETLCNERRSLGEQQRLQHVLHAWLLVHVPLSVLLLILGVLHVVLSLYY